jgi:Domain of unknown function (DUF3597)
MDGYRQIRKRPAFCNAAIRRPALAGIEIRLKGKTMSIFDNIMSAIFGSASRHAEIAPGLANSAPASSSGGAPTPQVDVEAVMTKLASQNSEKLDWRRSIVDLMKLLDLDSSLGTRKQLAQELHYPGDTSDSSSMNVWLHKQVMQKLAENGGKLPSALKS